VLGSAGIEGTVLRYGRLYGPGTSAPTDGPVAPGGRSSDGAIPLPPHPRVHVRTAARAAIAALERGAPGIYDIVDRGGPVSGARARTDLGLD
jgi:nucleoside-diphosphate-sugar epimerase